MTESTNSRELHSEVWEELAWYANGSLPAADRERVESHLQGCAECTRELAFWSELRSHVGRDEPLLLTPKRSLEKVWGRIDAVRAAERGWLRWGDLGRIARARLPKAAWPALLRPAVIGAISIVAIVAGLVVMYEPAGEFRTLSSSGAPVASSTPLVRVVFDGDATADDIQGLLNEVGAEIVAGPSSYGVYTVGLRPPFEEGRRELLIRELRLRAVVRFAEPVAAAEPDREP